MSDEVVKVDSRDITLVVLAFLGLAAASVLLVVNIVFLTRQARDAAEKHRGACSYRANLQQQAVSTEKYLAKHPDGVPALGISAAQLRATIERLQAGAGALSGLHCAP